MPDPITRLNAALEGRYRIERELGEGGMATVYLADDLKHERRVALKVLKPELAAVVGAERFLAEIKTTANLTHPNILPLHDSGEADGFLFYKSRGRSTCRVGFRNDTSEDAPICRWLTSEGHRVDVMSQNESVLGFFNRWYALALSRAVPYDLGPDLQIRVPPAPVFLATKCEAWVNRGGGDYWKSHDMEDIITLVAGRPELPQEVRAEKNELRNWISEQVTIFLAADDFYYALQGALPDTSQIPGLLGEVRAQFGELVTDGTT